MKKVVDESICYTGKGALKKKNHTRREYMGVMKKHFRGKCKEHIQAKKCKPCVQSKELNTKEAKKQIDAFKKKKKYKMNKRTEKKIVNLMKKCRACKTRRRKDCDLEEYLEYSGAFKGKC